LSNRKNIIVIADEAHRTQYGFAAKTIDQKDDRGNVVGTKVVYGFAKYLRDALPNATYLGFTGTPIEKTDVNTPAVFGNYVDIYDIAQAVEDGFAYEEFFEADTSKKLSVILAAENHILGLPDGKKRYTDAVTALSKAFAIAVPHEQAMELKDEIGFFQAVKARLIKFEISGDGSGGVDLDTTIRQVIDQALVSDQVIDVFDAAGIKKPEISILSEEFLLELKNHEHENVAIEVLRKLLNDELKARSRTNLVRSRALLEMLENAIKRYQNKVLTAAEVMEELISVSQEIKHSDKEAEQLGLSDYEYAFYTAVASNKSAQELMQQDKLRELAVVLTQRVRENASIDWTIKESVRSKLKVIVRRLLRQYGYPPDMQLLATETVLQQAEMIADELTTK
jgi:type I restriction enzyme, R subunit